MKLTSQQLDFIFSPVAIRDRAEKIYNLSLNGKTHFQVHPEKLDEAAQFVFSVIQENYPDFQIPFHSRWGHFRAGGIKRDEFLNLKIKSLDKKEQARIKLDLVITSVLLDAGAGAAWSYLEESSQKTFSRSEGLGIASFYLFLSGAMSMSKGTEMSYLRADAQGLQNVTTADVEKYFQVTEKNPLIGVAGRVGLLKSLGKALQNKKIFKDQRPGNILDYLVENHLNADGTIPATALLRAVIDGLGSIWPSRIEVECENQKINLGDVWSYPQFSPDTNSLDSLVPFHKLSQWMTYSLVEPIEEAGFKVVGAEKLTGLAEYRNGGLIIDAGLAVCRDPKDLTQDWAPHSEFIIEWRALTIYFLDRIGEKVQKTLGKNALEFPLAKVLEGGTWWAGRKIAKQKRSDGGPPVNIISDGTVF